MIMIQIKFFIGVAACALCLTISGCSDEGAKTEKLEKAIGTEFVQAIRNSETMTAVRILPNHLQAIPDGPMKEDQVKTFVKLVLNDDHYYFDRTKKCLFIPEIAFQIKGEKIIFVSESAKQLKFVDGGSCVILDYDPMAALIESEF